MGPPPAIGTTATDSISFGFSLHSLPVATPKFNVVQEHTYDGYGHCDYDDYGGVTPCVRSGASTPYSMYSMYSSIPMSTADVVLAFLREANTEDLGPPAAALACRSRINSMTSLCSEQQQQQREAEESEDQQAGPTAAGAASELQAYDSSCYPDPLPPWHPSKNPHWLAAEAGRAADKKQRTPHCSSSHHKKPKHTHSFISISADCATPAANSCPLNSSTGTTAGPEDASSPRFGWLGLGRLVKWAVTASSGSAGQLPGVPPPRSTPGKGRCSTSVDAAAEPVACHFEARIRKMQTERDEALKLKEALQHKLGALEASHAALAAAHQELTAALQASKADASHLNRKLEELMARLEVANPTWHNMTVEA